MVEFIDVSFPSSSFSQHISCFVCIVAGVGNRSIRDVLNTCIIPRNTDIGYAIPGHESSWKLED